MSDKKKSGAKKGKDAKSSGPPRNANEVRLSEHPRAQRSINLAKSYAGLGACGLAAFVAWRGGAQFLDVAGRALMWGVAVYVMVWAMSVQVWRHLAVAEVRAAEKRWKERRDAEEERVRKLTAILEENGMPTTGTGVPPR
jgi:hypothetical protein